MFTRAFAVKLWRQRHWVSLQDVAHASFSRLSFRKRKVPTDLDEMTMTGCPPVDEIAAHLIAKAKLGWEESLPDIAEKLGIKIEFSYGSSAAESSPDHLVISPYLTTFEKNEAIASGLARVLTKDSAVQEHGLNPEQMKELETSIRTVLLMPSSTFRRAERVFEDNLEAIADRFGVRPNEVERRRSVARYEVG